MARPRKDAGPAEPRAALSVRVRPLTAYVIRSEAARLGMSQGGYIDWLVLCGGSCQNDNVANVMPVGFDDVEGCSEQ